MINILKIWYLGSCQQCSLNVLINMHAAVENYWDAKILGKLSGHCFFVITAMKLTILLKQFINNQHVGNRHSGELT